MSGVIVLNQLNAKLVDGYGSSLAIPDGYAIATSNLGILATGSDGAQARFLRVSSDGTVKVDPSGTTAQPILIQSTSAVRTVVAASATAVTLLAANSARKGATIYNDSSSILRLAMGTQDSTTTDFSVAMAADSYFETPFGFTGRISGLWASAVGAARISEIS